MNSPNRTARIAGALYLVVAIAMGFSFTAAGNSLIVPGDATATADQVLASESLFRIGFVGDSVTFLSETVLLVMLYLLFRPVSNTLSLIAVLFRLGMTIMQGMNLLNKVTALLLLGGADYLTVFNPDQLDALALLFLNAYEYGALIWGTFFGLHLLFLACLFFQSNYFPRIFGALFIFASLGYLVDSYGNLLLPQYTAVYTAIVWATVPAEMAFAFWLLIKGVNVEQWEKRALESA